MPELGSSGSVRGAASNGRPYRECVFLDLCLRRSKLAGEGALQVSTTFRQRAAIRTSPAG